MSFLFFMYSVGSLLLWLNATSDAMIPTNAEASKLL